AVNVEAQRNNPHSLFWWMKHVMAVRQRFRAFGRGSLEFLHADNPRVLAFVRRYPPHPQPLSTEGRGEKVAPLAPGGRGVGGEGEEIILVVATLSRFVQHAELDLGAYRGLRPVEMYGRVKFPPVGDRPYFLTLGRHAFYWFTLEPVPADRLPGPAEEDL